MVRLGRVISHSMRIDADGPVRPDHGGGRGGTSMSINGTRGYHSGLVDLATGLISREIFVNDDIYAQEQERVPARCMCSSIRAAIAE
jgi:hypothetical protein